MVASDVATHEASWPPGGSAEAFGGVVDPYRRELLVHCYRMLGSIDDAEDALQDALANAWHRRNTYQRDVSFRAWLYRIATNACLDAIGRRKRRSGSEVHIGVGPFPGRAPGRSGRRRARGAVRRPRIDLARVPDGPPAVAATAAGRPRPARCPQLACGRGRGAARPERARGQQRVAAGSRDRLPPYGQPGRSGPRVAPTQPQPGGLLERYVRAWESADVAGLVALLREDALLTMPPRPSVAWRRARSASSSRRRCSTTARPMRLVPTRANGSPAFLAYANPGRGERFDAFALLVLGRRRASRGPDRRLRRPGRPRAVRAAAA